MGHRHVRLFRRVAQKLAQFGELSRALEDPDVAILDEGDTGAVVAPVFEPLELVEHDVDAVPGAEIAGNAAHGSRDYEPAGGAPGFLITDARHGTMGACSNSSPRSSSSSRPSIPTSCPLAETDSWGQG